MITHRVWIGIAGFVLAAIAVIAFVASGSSLRGGTPKARLSAWVTSAALGQSIGTLRGDHRAIGLVLKNHRGTGALHTACGVITTDAEAANSTLPSPDVKVTQELAKAYATTYDVGVDCYKAGVGNHRALRHVEQTWEKATRLLTTALLRIETVTKETVVTTTTIGPTTGTSFF